MSSTVTVTGKEMGGITVTARVIPNVRQVVFDVINQMLRVTRNDDFIEEFDVNAASTLTGTVSSGNWTFTVS